jgi:hypothetical protein
MKGKREDEKKTKEEEEREMMRGKNERTSKRDRRVGEVDNK